ncbi:MAG TPA: type II toxin-antitoxin system HicB family antitoxin [Armatimonadota bacterium]|nr:type II toxin-antitoxin system HicB family antitoxin [Armatimonadota bacterium]
MKEYVVIYEKGPTSWGAHVPDLPICVAVGDSYEEVEKLIKEAINAYVDELKAEGKPIPEPVTQAGCVSIAA